MRVSGSQACSLEGWQSPSSSSPGATHGSSGRSPKLHPECSTLQGHHCGGPCCTHTHISLSKSAMKWRCRPGVSSLLLGRGPSCLQVESLGSSSLHWESVSSKAPGTSSQGRDRVTGLHSRDFGGCGLAGVSVLEG